MGKKSPAQQKTYWWTRVPDGKIYVPRHSLRSLVQALDAIGSEGEVAEVVAGLTEIRSRIVGPSETSSAITTRPREDLTREEIEEVWGLVKRSIKIREALLRIDDPSFSMKSRRLATAIMRVCDSLQKLQERDE